MKPKKYMKESWKELGFKDKALYATAIAMIASAIIIAFTAFILTTTIASGVLIYIALALCYAGGIFGVSIYFRSKLGEFESKVEEMIKDK